MFPHQATPAASLPGRRRRSGIKLGIGLLATVSAVALVMSVVRTVREMRDRAV